MSEAWHFKGHQQLSDQNKAGSEEGLSACEHHGFSLDVQVWRVRSSVTEKSDFELLSSVEFFQISQEEGRMKGTLEQLAFTLWIDIIYTVFLKRFLLEFQCGPWLNRLRITRACYVEAEKRWKKLQVKRFIFFIFYFWWNRKQGHLKVNQEMH